MKTDNTAKPVMADKALFVLGRHIHESLWQRAIERYPQAKECFDVLPDFLKVLLFKPHKDFMYSIGGIWGAVSIERHMRSLLRLGEHGMSFIPEGRGIRIISCSFSFENGKKNDPVQLQAFVDALHEEADSFFASSRPDADWRTILQNCRNEVDVFDRIAPLLGTPEVLPVQAVAEDDVLSPLAGLVPIRAIRLGIPLHNGSVAAPVAQVQCAMTILPPSGVVCANGIAVHAVVH